LLGRGIGRVDDDELEAGEDGDDDDDALTIFKAVCWRGTARRLAGYVITPDEVLGGSILSILVALGIDTWLTCPGCPFTPYVMRLPNWAVCGT
jgi:hypothetical protein